MCLTSVSGALTVDITGEKGCALRLLETAKILSVCGFLTCSSLISGSGPIKATAFRTFEALVLMHVRKGRKVKVPKSFLEDEFDSSINLKCYFQSTTFIGL